MYSILPSASRDTTGQVDILDSGHPESRSSAGLLARKDILRMSRDILRMSRQKAVVGIWTGVLRTDEYFLGINYRHNRKIMVNGGIKLPNGRQGNG